MNITITDPKSDSCKKPVVVFDTVAGSWAFSMDTKGLGEVREFISNNCVATILSIDIRCPLKNVLQHLNAARLAIAIAGMMNLPFDVIDLEYRDENDSVFELEYGELNHIWDRTWLFFP